MKLAKTQMVDQLDHAAIRLVSARRELFARQGSVVASYRYRTGRRFGPYYRLAYRDGGRQGSVYLGRAAAVVARVRHMLHDLQHLLRLRRMYARVDRQGRGFAGQLRPGAGAPAAARAAAPRLPGPRLALSPLATGCRAAGS